MRINFLNKNSDQPKSNFPKIERLLEHNAYQIFVTIITIYALFGDDIRILATTKSSDIYFDVITVNKE